MTKGSTFNIIHSFWWQLCWLYCSHSSHHGLLRTIINSNESDAHHVVTVMYRFVPYISRSYHATVFIWHQMTSCHVMSQEPLHLSHYTDWVPLTRSLSVRFSLADSRCKERYRKRGRWYSCLYVFPHCTNFTSLYLINQRTLFLSSTAFLLHRISNGSDCHLVWRWEASDLLKLEEATRLDSILISFDLSLGVVKRRASDKTFSHGILFLLLCNLLSSPSSAVHHGTHLNILISLDNFSAKSYHQ